MSEPIRVIATGGTIDDRSADAVTGKSVFGETNVPTMLQEVHSVNGIVFDDLMRKDSSDITDEDRRIILERCRSCPEKRIVITHGTNAMVETAKVLGENIRDKTVVLVGAFVPYTKAGSDAVSNLGHAITVAGQLPAGVYVAMNGRIFPWTDVRKNRI